MPKDYGKGNSMVVHRRDARIEAKMREGTSPNKGTQELAAMLAWFSVVPEVNPQDFSAFATMIKEFSKVSRSYQNQPGFSNQTVDCVGLTVSRSFLAEVCDNDRLMGTVTPSCISLIETAKHELNMRSALVFKVAGKQARIDKTNLPGPVKMNKKLREPESLEDQIYWLWIGVESIPGL